MPSRLTFSAFIILLFNSQNCFAQTEQSSQSANSSVKISQAATLLRFSRELQEQSVFSLTQSQSVRDAVLALRRSLNTESKKNFSQGATREKIKHIHTHPHTQEAFSDLAKQISHWRELGGTLRQQSEELKNLAKTLLVDQMATRWPSVPNIHHRFIVKQSANSIENSQSHNQAIRSTQKNRNDVLAHQQRDDPTMSLNLPAASGQSIPESLDTNTFQLSDNRNYFIHIQSWQGAQQALPLNKIHSWKLFLTDINGTPINNVKIEFSGHMPGHVHGLPTQPEIISTSNPGVYRIDGVKFQMRGWWVIDLTISHDSASETARFNILL